MNTDRRLIEPFLADVFPNLRGASSDEWHFFLDTLTGVNTSLDEGNGVAFDRWREALAGMGYNVTTHSEQRAAAAKALVDGMVSEEKRRVASQDATLKRLRGEAPDWPVAEVLASVNG